MLGLKNGCTAPKQFFTLKMANFLNIAPKRWCQKQMLPCERLLCFWKWPIFSKSPPRGDAKNATMWTTFVLLEMAKFSQHRPQQSNAKCVWHRQNSHFHQHCLHSLCRIFQCVLHFLMDCLRKRARAARKHFQYIPHFLMDCLRKKPRAARTLF